MGAARSGELPRHAVHPVRWLLTGSRLPSLLVMLSSVALVVVVYAPGLMTPDSTAVIMEAWSGEYTDWHSPLLSALWGVVIDLGFGPFWVLVTTLTVLVAAVYFLLRPFLPRLGAAVAAALFPISPPLIGYVAQLMRDTWFTVLFAAAFGLCVRGVRPGISDRRRLLLAAASIGCSWLALTCRQNGITSLVAMLVPPVIVAWPVLARRLGGRLRSPARRAVVGIGAWAVLLAAVVGSQQALLRTLDVRHLHPEQATQINDLAAMSIRRGEMLFSPVAYPQQDLALLAEQSTVFNIDPLVFGDAAAIKIPILEPERLEALRDDWIAALRAHPLDYLAVRAELWARQVSITDHTYQAVDLGMQPNPLGYDPYFPGLTDIGRDYSLLFVTKPAEGGVLHTVWAYLLVTVVAMGWLLRTRSRLHVVLVLMGVASLLYTAGMFVGATSLQYRYSYPCVLTGMVLGIVLVADVVRTWRRTATSPGHGAAVDAEPHPPATPDSDLVTTRSPRLAPIDPIIAAGARRPRT